MTFLCMLICASQETAAAELELLLSRSTLSLLLNHFKLRKLFFSFVFDFRILLGLKK